VLDDAGEAAVVVSGRGLRFAEHGPGGRGDRYVAVVASAGAGVDPLWLADRKLLAGADRSAAKPVTGKPYALLRLGARSTRQTVREFIDEIRRRHRRGPGEAAADRGESFASFVDRQLDKRRRELIEATYGHHKMYPVVTPIAVEAAADLEATVAFSDELPSRFKQLIDGMRASLQGGFGVKIPGIRVRLNESDLSPGMYVILLDEVPLVHGSVDPQKLLCLADRSVLTRPPFDGTWSADLVAPTLPDGSGRAACWIPLERGDEVRAAGLETLDAAGYIELHLRSVLVSNLDMFATLDDVAERLSEEAGARIRRCRGGLARFVEVLRSLLLEELPITPLEPLAERYLALADGPPVEVAEELRLIPAVHEHLTRDAGRWTPFALADDYEARIRGAVYREGDAEILALEPEFTQALLSAVRNEVGSKPDGARRAVVVEDWRLRPFIRNLLVLEFPRLRIVARRELAGLAGLPAPTTTIVVEP
jgi:type III secretory pathway component EscV